MKKMLVLTRFVKEYEPVRLAEEGRKAGFEVDLIKYGQVDLKVVEGKMKIDLGKKRRLADYDLIVPRAASKKGSSLVSIKTVVLSEARKLGIVVINGESFFKYPLLGKIEQGMMMARVGLPTVDFVTFGSKLGWRKYMKTLQSAEGSELSYTSLRTPARGGQAAESSEPSFVGFPLIVKGRFGSHGRTVRLVKNKEELEKVYGEYKEGSVLIQPKLRVKQWYRCIVVNGVYLGEMRHRQKDKYGGEVGLLTKLNKPKMDRLKDICVKAVCLFECDYAGIDVVWDEKASDFKILEVNRTAQFKYFEKRTGVNVAGKVIVL